MKILYLVKKEEGLSDTFKEIIASQKASGNIVKVVNLYENKTDYDALIDDIFSCDKVISL